MISQFPNSLYNRHHMAWRTANQKSIQQWFINTIVGLAVFLELTVCLAMFIPTYFYSVPFGHITAACYHSVNGYPNFIPIGPAITIILMVLALTTGIVFDLKMLFFLRSRQSVKPEIAMVSWNRRHQPPLISHGKNDQSSKLTIPIQATCLGVVNLSVILVFGFIANSGFFLGEYTVYFLLSLATTCLAVHMPLVLLLTVKSNENKVTKTLVVAPPARLQFHEEFVSNSNLI